MAASFLTLGVSRAGSAPHAAGHTEHLGLRALAGPDLFGFSRATALENPNKSRALAHKPDIPGIRFGLDGDTSRQSADYATGKAYGSGKVNLFADVSCLAPMVHDHGTAVRAARPVCPARAYRAKRRASGPHTPATPGRACGMGDNRLKLTPGHRRSTLASTRSAEGKCSVALRTSIRSPLDDRALVHKVAGHSDIRIFEPHWIKYSRRKDTRQRSCLNSPWTPTAAQSPCTEF
jgi:hypothetical protein